MKGGLSNLMKQVQQMQTNLKQAQEDLQQELARLRVTGQSGGGLVTVIMTGRHEVERVSIDNSLLKEDKDMLEDLVTAAINDAVHKVEKEIEKTTQNRFSQAGLNLPEGIKLPF